MSEEVTKTEEVKINMGELYLDEVNYILGLLSKEPFERVAGLIAKIRGIAIPQLKDMPAASEPAPEETKGDSE